MFQDLKRALYFPLAHYFRFFAKIKLARWNPRIIVIMGSSGKTTLLHLIEAQLGEKARYSHHANSSYGIPFDVLGLERKTLLIYEWIGLFLKAPFLAFSSIPKQKIYIVEADCDRPGEGRFLSTFLKPEVTIWLSLSRTHSMNFDEVVEQNKFSEVEQAIAYEYGYFLEDTSKLAMVNSDSEFILKQLPRGKNRVLKISKQEYLKEYKVSKTGTIFKISENLYKFPYLLPEASYFSIVAARKLTSYLGFREDPSFKNFEIPPGRGSIFAGIKNITIIDSSYNSNLSSATEVIKMFNLLDTDKKWAVIGDMLEQGKSEKEEHEKLARLIDQSSYDHVVLLGPRIIKYGLPVFEKRYEDHVVSFESPKDVLNYLKSNLQGGETILFKGARFLEGVIEHLLANPEDAKSLPRREKMWEIRRKEWEL